MKPANKDPSTKRPSFLTLDRYALYQKAKAGELGKVEASALMDPETVKATEAYIAECDECKAYLADLNAPGFVPGWVHTLAKEKQTPSLASKLRQNSLRYVGFGGVVIAAAAAWMVVYLNKEPLPGGQPVSEQAHGEDRDAQTGNTGSVLGSPRVDRPYIGSKGGGEPELWLHIDRQGKELRFAEGDTIRPGDKLQLEIAGSSFTHLLVLAQSANGSPAELFRSEVQGHFKVPTAWSVDDQGSEEVLYVILSKEELSLQRAHDALSNAKTPAQPQSDVQPQSDAQPLTEIRATGVHQDEERWIKKLFLKKTP